ncbi:proline-rich protein HaeIII subfamily 1-like [Lontra canadensis]|uniref:proline-rich protein HaeIII subfamily 1-like n=1 Tax=Lontra canadensis TaxID=76717 RepID=UPI0013F3883C|nr:proline-rich protein HaeIII subfamily 1-like [Lontra canadensis]
MGDPHTPSWQAAPRERRPSRAPPPRGCPDQRQRETVRTQRQPAGRRTRTRGVSARLPRHGRPPPCELPCPAAGADTTTRSPGHPATAPRPQGPGHRTPVAGDTFRVPPRTPQPRRRTEPQQAPPPPGPAPAERPSAAHAH